MIRTLALFLILQISGSSFGQTTEAAASDAALLMQEYLDPLAKGTGYGLASGWLNSSKIDQPFRFSFVITPMVLAVPESDLSYRTDNIGLENTVQINGNTAPTFFGLSGEDNRPEYEFTDPGNSEVTIFTGPEGIDLKKRWNDAIGIKKPLFPFGVFNVSFTLPIHTKVYLRWFPPLGIGEETQAKFWGAGVQHDFTRWLFDSEMPPVHVSLFAGYSSLKYVTDLRTEDVTVDNDVFTSDGEGIFDVGSVVVQALVSRELGKISFYAGPGYIFVQSKTDIRGTFSYTSGNEVKDVIDPISYSDRQSSFRFSLGARLKLGFFTLHVAQNFQKYNSTEMGIGFEF